MQNVCDAELARQDDKIRSCSLFLEQINFDL